MEAKLKFKGIATKTSSDEEQFIVKFEVVTDDWEDALDVKELIETKIANLLSGQTTLKE